MPGGSAAAAATYTSTVHSCSSGKVACETTVDERLEKWKQREVGSIDYTEKKQMEKCFPGFQHGRFFQAVSAKLLLSWGRKERNKVKKKKKKMKKNPANGAIGFHSVPEENVNHNMDPASPLVSCIGQVRAGSQRRSGRRSHCRIMSEENVNAGGRWKMCMPCSSSNSSSVEEKQGIQLILRSTSASVPSSHKSMISGGETGQGCCMLAKSLVLLQQQMDKSIINEKELQSSLPSPIAQRSKNQGEVCLWKRRCIPQPQSLQL